MKVINDFFYIYSEKEPMLENVCFIFEGENTEPFFIKKCLDYIRNNLYGKINISFIEKTGSDKGKTAVKQLLAFAGNQIKAGKADKVIVVLDLDIYNNDQKRINTLIKKASKNIIIAYTNPSFELFVFSLIKDSFKKIVFPNKDKILNNEQVLNDKGSKERYIYHLLKKEIGFDAKNKKSLENYEFESLFDNMDEAIKQEKLINQYLDCAAHQLTSNVCNVLTLLKDGKLDDINYLKERKGEKYES